MTAVCALHQFFDVCNDTSCIARSCFDESRDIIRIRPAELAEIGCNNKIGFLQMVLVVGIYGNFKSIDHHIDEAIRFYIVSIST